MKQITNAEVLILSIVAEMPVHGYDINKILEERNVRKWTDMGFSSIYYVLDKLESKGLLKSAETTGKERKLYSITTSGLETLKTQSAMMIQRRFPAQSHLMTGLAASWILEEEAQRDAFSKRLEILEQDYDVLLRASSISKNTGDAPRRLFELSEVLLEAEINWIKLEIERMSHED